MFESCRVNVEKGRDEMGHIDNGKADSGCCIS